MIPELVIAFAAGVAAARWRPFANYLVQRHELTAEVRSLKRLARQQAALNKGRTQ